MTNYECTAFTTQLGTLPNSYYNKMPGHGGVVATQRIKMDEDLKHIPVIFFTANDDIVNFSQLAEADAYLAKPFELTNLFNTIQQISQIQEESILI